MGEIGGPGLEALGGITSAIAKPVKPVASEALKPVTGVGDVVKGVTSSPELNVNTPTSVSSILEEGATTSSTTPEFSEPTIGGIKPKAAEAAEKLTPEGLSDETIKREEQERKMALLRQLQREEIQIKLLIDEVQQRNGDGRFSGDITRLNSQLGEVRNRIGTLGMEISTGAMKDAINDAAAGKIANAVGAAVVGAGATAGMAEEGI